MNSASGPDRVPDLDPPGNRRTVTAWRSSWPARNPVTSSGRTRRLADGIMRCPVWAGVWRGRRTDTRVIECALCADPDEQNAGSRAGGNRCGDANIGHCIGAAIRRFCRRVRVSPSQLRSLRWPLPSKLRRSTTSSPQSPGSPSSTCAPTEAMVRAARVVLARVMRSSALAQWGSLLLPARRCPVISWCLR